MDRAAPSASAVRLSGARSTTADAPATASGSAAPSVNDTRSHVWVEEMRPVAPAISRATTPTSRARAIMRPRG